MPKTKIISFVFAAFLSLLAFAVGPVSAKPVLVSQARITATQLLTRFEADLSTSVGFSATVVSDPYRVIIDIADANFNLPTGAGRKPSGLITAFRYGMVEERKSRIVLDVIGPVLLGKSVVVPAKGKKPARLLVEFSPTTAENFKAVNAQDNGPVIQTASADQTGAISKAPPIPAAAAPAIPNADAAQIKIIAIDPGHGGIDPGASSPNKTKEKDVVLAYGLALRDALLKSGKYKVVMTRDKDVFVSLENRVKFARDNKADLFIAVHADTVEEGDVRGTTIYTVSDKATDAVAEALAQKENRADVIAGIDLGNQTKEVSDVLINLAQRESKNDAMFFAKKAVDQLKPIAHFTGKPIRSAAFVVLKAPDVPSVLVELGYLSSSEDEAVLKSSEWRANMASALAKSIDDYFAPAATKVSSQ